MRACCPCLAFAGAGVQDTGAMVAGVRTALIRLIVVALIAMLGAGNGLSGWVRAIATSEHVCTCASGGDHASCPICNPALGRRAHSGALAVDGVPCGQRHGSIQVAGEPLLVSPPALLAPCPFERACAPGIAPDRPSDVAPEPTTPPPRIA